MTVSVLFSINPRSSYLYRSQIRVANFPDGYLAIALSNSNPVRFSRRQSFIRLIGDVCSRRMNLMVVQGKIIYVCE